MTSAMDALEAVGKKRSKKARWHLAPFAPVREGTVLAFDQSLAATGWVEMQGSEVLRGGMIRTEPLAGNEGTLVRAVEIHGSVQALVGSRAAVGPVTVVHEAPPATSRGMHRSDASLVAAVAIRIVAEGLGVPVVMVSSQQAKRRVTGNANAKKPEVREGLEALLGGAPIRPWNEHVRDAVILGVVAMERPDDN